MAARSGEDTVIDGIPDQDRRGAGAPEMESLAAYFDRKHEELWVLNQCLRTPLDVVRPRSVVEIIGNKFRLTAALKAQHELDDWAFTETAWAAWTATPQRTIRIQL